MVVVEVTWTMFSELDFRYVQGGGDRWCEMYRVNFWALGRGVGRGREDLLSSPFSRSRKFMAFSLRSVIFTAFSLRVVIFPAEGWLGRASCNNS